MDFLTTMNVLLDIETKIGHPFHYRFDESGLLQIELVPDAGVPAMFDNARKMFEPID